MVVGGTSGVRGLVGISAFAGEIILPVKAFFFVLV